MNITKSMIDAAHDACLDRVGYALERDQLLAVIEAALLARAEAQDEGAAGEPVEDKPWPDTPLANALHDHFVWTYGLNQEEASESAGDILDIIAKHDAHPSPTPAADADRVRKMVEALERIGKMSERPHEPGEPYQAARAALQQETQP